MASRIKYACSATPIYTLSNAEAASDVDVIAADVGKTLGGSGEISCGFGNTLGYASGAPAYTTTATNWAVGQSGTSLGTMTDSRFIYIKHTGYLYSSSSALGNASALQVKIHMVQTIANATTLAILGPGDAIMLPFNINHTPTLFATGNGAAIAMEIMQVRDS
jgi:hypothetical protein